MAHSLFEPAPPPLGEKLWRRFKEFSLSRPAHALPDRKSVAPTDPDLLRQANGLDARGQQKLLETVFQDGPVRSG